MRIGWSAVVLGAACVGWPHAHAQSERLPDLPRLNTSHFQPAIRAEIEHAESEAAAHPRDAQEVGTLAMTLHAYQQYAPAVQAYTRAHRLDPKNYDWLYLRGAAELADGQFQAARKSLESALEIRPNDLAAQVRLAQSLAGMGAWDEAGAVARRILAQHARSAQAWYGLGRAQQASGDHVGAAESYAKACELFPQYGAAHFALAQELRRAGKSAQAQEHLALYQKYVTAEPPLDDPLFERIHELNHGVQAHIQRGAELEKAGRFEDAVREHEAALAVDPNNVQVRVNLISLYARTGDKARAKEQFETAIRLNPGRSDAWYNYGVLLYGERQVAEAAEAFRHAIAINPNYAEAHNNLGAIEEQQGKLDDAEREFREAIAAQPDYPLARFHLGRILVNRQSYQEAIREFQRALTPEDEKTPTYIYALAATYARAGDRVNALEYFGKARDAAAARGQSQLLTSIERDLKTLGGGR
ncbi:MAG TPA: tetratricopeptide repeat protein [Bryobacteraceae bacterium]|nr:tetratricopeptide repeat protein [Bryobacteraceae bacterium]